MGVKPDLVLIDYVDLLRQESELESVRKKLMIFMEVLKD